MTSQGARAARPRPVWRVARILLLAGGAAILGTLLARTGPSVVAGMLRRVGIGFLWVSVLYVAHTGMRAAALWRSLPPGRVSYRDVLRIRFAGEAIEQLTFTGPLLAEPTKGWLLNRLGVTSADAFGAVAIEYLCYAVVSAWMATVALSVLLARGALPQAFRDPVIGILGILIAFSAGPVYASISGTGLIVPAIRIAGALIGERRAAAVVSRVDPIERVLVAFMHERPRRVGEVLAFEIGAHALLVCEIWIVLDALSVRFAAADPLLLEGCVKFITVAFAFVPGQIGAAEGVYALVASALGLPVATGLTLALVRRIRALIVASVGLATLRSPSP